jgi:hypothetical protein
MNPNKASLKLAHSYNVVQNVWELLFLSFFLRNLTITVHLFSIVKNSENR